MPTFAHPWRWCVMYRCDHQTHGPIETTWHASEDDALAEASRLRFAGVVLVVAWFDSQGVTA